MNSALITFLKTFREIPAKDQELINAIAETREYKEGDSLLKEGSIAKEMFFIVDGVLKIVAINQKGIEATYFFLKPNQFCTILNSFNNQVQTGEGIRAASDTKVMVLPRNRLFDIYKKLPYLQDLIDQITTQALLDKIQIRNNYAGLDASARYKLFIDVQPEIALHVPMADIASYLGITPQSLSRIRKNL